MCWCVSRLGGEVVPSAESVRGLCGVLAICERQYFASSSRFACFSFFFSFFSRFFSSFFSFLDFLWSGDLFSSSGIVWSSSIRFVGSASAGQRWGGSKKTKPGCWQPLGPVFPTTATAHRCPPCVSTMAAFTPAGFPSPNGTDSRTEVAQNRMAQRHHLSKALVVSLMKNIYSNRGFCRGKGRPFDLEVFWTFDTSLMKDLRKTSWMTFWFWSSSQVTPRWPYFGPPRFQGPPIKKTTQPSFSYWGGGVFFDRWMWWVICDHCLTVTSKFRTNPMLLCSVQPGFDPVHPGPAEPAQGSCGGRWDRWSTGPLSPPRRRTWRCTAHHLRPSRTCRSSLIGAVEQRFAALRPRIGGRPGWSGFVGDFMWYGQIPAAPSTHKVKRIQFKAVGHQIHLVKNICSPIWDPEK